MMKSVLKMMNFLKDMIVSGGENIYATECDFKMFEQFSAVFSTVLRLTFGLLLTAKG